jgi:hypothetical protein
VHLAAAANFVLADHRDVVLTVAGRDAGSATNAAVQVDAQAPTVTDTFHRMLFPKVELRNRLLVLRVDHAIAVHILMHGQLVGMVVRPLITTDVGGQEVSFTTLWRSMSVRCVCVMAIG